MNGIMAGSELRERLACDRPTHQWTPTLSGGCWMTAGGAAYQLVRTGDRLARWALYRAGVRVGAYRWRRDAQDAAEDLADVDATHPETLPPLATFGIGWNVRARRAHRGN